MEVKIRIKNLPQIRRAFGMAPGLMKSELNKAIRKSILTIGRTSRILTPVDTGRLRSSTRERFSFLQGEVGTHTNYDIFVHEGTRYMRPRPYLRRSVKRHEPDVDRFMQTAVQNVLNKIGRMT